MKKENTFTLKTENKNRNTATAVVVLAVAAVLLAIDQLEAQGYQFCTVSELALVHNGTLEPGMAYGCF